MLESKHVIGLFLLMLVFSGVFFSLGYVMGRNQYDGRVSAENNNAVGRLDPGPAARPDVAPKKTAAPPAESADSDPATPAPSGPPWKFEENSKAAAKSEPHLAALAQQDDALALAGSLQKRHFAAYVQTPQRDKFYRVQVGPFKDQKSADAAKKGLESAGFKAFYVKH